jgi:transposase
MPTAAPTADSRRTIHATHVAAGAGRGYAGIVRAGCPLIAAFDTHIAQLQHQVERLFHQYPDATVYRSQPGLGDILGARILGEFGDPGRFTGAHVSNNFAGTAPSPEAHPATTTPSAFAA